MHEFYGDVKTEVYRVLEVREGGDGGGWKIRFELKLL